MLSVVIPVYNVAPYLEECLESVLGQRLREIEVIAVDDGSTDGSTEILERFARRDARLTVVRQHNTGQGPARNRGVAIARGTFLTFLDADDTLPPAAYQHAVQTLRRTGSDFAVGDVQRVRNDSRSAPPWADVVHERDRLGITIDDFPDALQDVIACNRVFRRRFWVETVGGFEGRGAYEDHVPMVAAYVRADRFDVLKRVTYYWRVRENRTSTGQQKHELANLRDRVAVKAQAQELLETEASETVFSTWLGRVLDLDLPPYVKHALIADDEYRAVLSAAYRRHITMATPHAWRSVRVFHKLRAWHAAIGRWDIVEVIQQHVRDYGRPPRAVVRDGTVVADLEIVGALDPDTPHELFELSDSETALDARLLRASWDDPQSLRLRGWATVRAVGHGGPAHRLMLTLRRSDGGETVVLSPVPVDEPRANAAIAEPEADHAPAGFEVVVPVGRLLPGQASSRATARWVLEAEVSIERVTRRGVFSGPVGGGSAASQSLTYVDTGQHRVTPSWAARDGFVIEVAPAPRGEGGESSPGGPSVDDVRTGDGEVAVTLVGLPEDTEASVVLVGERLSVASQGRTDGGPANEVVLPLRAAALGGPVRALPSGSYALRLADSTPVGATSAFRTRLPLEQTTEDGAVRWTFSRTGEIRLTVMSGLGPTERSRWARRQVVHSFERSVEPAVEQVLVHARRGLSGGGPAAAIGRAVAELRPDLDLVWSTVDRSVAVPDGTRQVIVGSMEWAREVRRSRLVVADGPLDVLQPPSGRRWMNLAAVQPLTSQGRARWSAEGWSAARVREEQRRLGRWAVMAAAGEHAKAVIGSDLGFGGEIAVVGDPSTDLLVNADRAAARRVRERLRLDADAFVVLYAPADRPDDATGARTGRLTRLLDVRALQASLGPSAVILVRGGDAVAQGGERVLGVPGVLDVTDYPEEAGLLLAADAAVLDYTPMRVAWALTGRPAVLHQPDRETYTSLHPPLEGWEETETGPVVTTTGEVADALKDPSDLMADYASSVERVNATFNALADGRAAARGAAVLLDER
ncbi:bifunctional glycosyltransferase family 2 protein/CDP-glycerol:glycerophosphate glycerophosphotransferase [Mumia sp. zg.B53]|uniref:glycosyltransferase n=1 Tax=Mumia sp. zg.B53 TaxID=2855449 RepID=UPI001C6F2224|nr:glycosyltransferase [Mumia sp. zg.B53]MBW9214117.1 bifunctional glycosyltransferase family 2 protein/CDP-glycerol:glycerophosphate glycerophosphotransferase [Mumia sp. zg.B53]